MISASSGFRRRPLTFALGSIAVAIALPPMTAPQAQAATVEAAVGTALLTAAPSTVAPPLAPPLAPGSGWSWPVAPPRVLRPFAPPPTRWAAGHRGVDLAVAPGDMVRAPASGVVAYAGQLAGRGVLVVAHAGGLRSTFEPVVAEMSVGESVGAGQPIGKVADPGDSAGSHCAALGCLHWGVLRGETYLDPLALLRGPTVLLPL